MSAHHILGLKSVPRVGLFAVPTLIDETGSETKLLYNVNEIKTYIDRLH